MSTMKDSQFSCINGAVYPPNKPMEPRMEFSKHPVIFDSFQFLDFNENGNCIVGTSDIDGTFWEGTLLYFEHPNRMQRLDFTSHYIYCSMSDSKFINNNTIALAEDTGNINVLSVDDDKTIRSTNYFRMIERIPQLGVWRNSKRILSCSGKSIAIWDADSLDRKPLEIFRNYHLEAVTCIDTLKNDTNAFLSGGRDRNVCIWDMRKSDSASLLYCNEFTSISTVAWNQENDNYIIVGTQGGDIYLVDKREPEDFISVRHCFDANVNGIAFKDSKTFAVCGDTEEVLTLSCGNNYLDIISRDSDHKGYVKGLKWFDDKLFSCGMGKSIVKHQQN